MWFDSVCYTKWFILVPGIFGVKCPGIGQRQARKREGEDGYCLRLNRRLHACYKPEVFSKKRKKERKTLLPLSQIISHFDFSINLDA